MTGKAEPRYARPLRVVLSDALSPAGVEVLAAEPDLVVDDLSSVSPEELRERLPGAAGLIVRSGTTVDEALLAKADELRVIGRAGVGVDNIDLAAAARGGIAVLNAPSGNTHSTAELAFALLLALARRIPEADRSVRGGGWERSRLRGGQLHGKTLGILGAGRIGAEVGRRARAFGMSVLVHDPYLPDGRAAEMGAERVGLAELLERSDALTIHAPLTEETRGIIGAAELARMREGALLVNAARGGMVDEAALVDALRSGRLGGAALDVFEREPLPADHPLLSLERTVLTPHLGAATAEAQRAVAVEIAENVRDALLTGELRSPVSLPEPDPGAGARRAR